MTYLKRLFMPLTAVLIALTAHAAKTDELIWHSADSLPLLGTLAPDASKAYSRLPDSLQNRVRKEVWDLGLNSAGLAIRFRSDASAIGFKWKALNRFNMNHMTPTGIRGMDLYALDDDGTTWQSV